MKDNEFGPCRSKETSKPKVICPNIMFYQCTKCSRLIYDIYSKNIVPPRCCENKMEELTPIDKNNLESVIKIDYEIIGGYNSNAVKVYWKIINKNEEDMQPKWVYLKTFTGGQIKYLYKKNKNHVIFALADEDAYVYCDEDPCLECIFRCKRGFEIYVYVKTVGLIKVPLDKLHSNW